MRIINGNPPGELDFTQQERTLIEQPLSEVAFAYLRSYDPYGKRIGLPCLPLSIRDRVKKSYAYSIFYQIHGGPITFDRWTEQQRFDWPVEPKVVGQDSTKNVIFIYKYGMRSGCYARIDRSDPAQGYVTSQQYSFFNDLPDECYKRFIVHETGHAFDNALDGAPARVTGRRSDLTVANNVNTENSGFAGTKYTCWQMRTQGDNSGPEIFADQFTGWVYRTWDLSRVDPSRPGLGEIRRDFMNEYMPVWIEQKLVAY